MKTKNVVAALLMSAVIAWPASAQIGRKARVLDLNNAESISKMPASNRSSTSIWPSGLRSIRKERRRWESTTTIICSRPGLEHERTLNALSDKYLRRLRDEINPARLDRMGELRYKCCWRVLT